MLDLIHIPKIGIYYHVSIILLITTSAALVPILAEKKVLKKIDRRYVDVGLKCSVLILAVAFLPSYWIKASILKIISAILFGVAVAFAWCRLELYVTSRFRKQSSLNKHSLPSEQGKRRLFGANKKHKEFPIARKKRFQIGISFFILIAVIEEALYRGFLFDYLVMKPFLLFVIFSGLSSIVFGFSHFGLGIEQAVLKSMLSFLLFILSYFSGPFWLASSIHCAINIFSYRFLLRKGLI